MFSALYSFIRRYRNPSGYISRLCKPPRSRAEAERLRFLHRGIQQAKDLQALGALLTKQADLEEKDLTRAVEVVRHQILTHPEVKSLLDQLERADKFVQEFSGRIAALDHGSVLVEFEINGEKEVRQFQRREFPRPNNLYQGQRVLVHSALEVLPYFEPLNESEKADFTAAVEEVNGLCKAIMRKSKGFSDVKK